MPYGERERGYFERTACDLTSLLQAIGCRDFFAARLSRQCGPELYGFYELDGRVLRYGSSQWRSFLDVYAVCCRPVVRSCAYCRRSQLGSKGRLF